MFCRQSFHKDGNSQQNNNNTFSNVKNNNNTYSNAPLFISRQAKGLISPCLISICLTSGFSVVNLASHMLHRNGRRFSGVGSSSGFSMCSRK